MSQLLTAASFKCDVCDTKNTSVFSNGFADHLALFFPMISLATCT